MPVVLYTDNGPKLANRNPLAYLDERGMKWKHGLAHTPQIQGLVELMVKTL